jgi:hypothetical protein
VKIVRRGKFIKVNAIVTEDTRFENCNFSRKVPHTNAVDVTGSPAIEFFQCNLMNIDPPPGSVVDDCLTVQKEEYVVETVTITNDDSTVLSEDVKDWRVVP